MNSRWYQWWSWLPKPRNFVSRKSSCIGAGTVVSGDIIFSGVLRVDGAVNGVIRSSGGPTDRLVIGVSGQVTGKLVGGQMVISGAITGPVETNSSLELQAGAQLTGLIRSAVLCAHVGAVIDGQVEIARARNLAKDVRFLDSSASESPVTSEDAGYQQA